MSCALDVRQIIELEHVIAGDRVPGLICVVALDIGQPAVGHTKEYSTVVVVEKKQVPERRTL